MGRRYVCRFGILLARRGSRPSRRPITRVLWVLSWSLLSMTELPSMPWKTGSSRSRLTLQRMSLKYLLPTRLTARIGRSAWIRAKSCRLNSESSISKWAPRRTRTSVRCFTLLGRKSRIRFWLENLTTSSARETSPRTSWKIARKRRKAPAVDTFCFHDFIIKPTTAYSIKSIYHFKCHIS